MLRSGILNPAINELISRFRHTNVIVIADRGFPYWPQVPTIDLSLMDGIPTVAQVLRALTPIVIIGNAWMASEFRSTNPQHVTEQFEYALGNTKLTFETHIELKRRVPAAIGLIRTGDTIPYANVVLESA